MDIKPVPVNTYLAEIEEFSNAVPENRRPWNDDLKSLDSQRLKAACNRSAKTGKAIDVK